MSSESESKLTVDKNWQHSPEYSQQKIPNKLKHLLETATLSDCEFIVGGETAKKFRAHKFLLTMTSAVFESMFYGSMAEENSIKITDLEPEIFQKILEYIYTDTIKLTSFDEACLVYIGAKKYLLNSLIIVCVSHIHCFINTSNACKAYEFAKFVEEPDLICRCVDILRSNTSAILQTDNYEDISLDVLKVISEQDNLCIASELDLFNALEKCVEQNTSNSDSHNGVTYQDVLKNIRFLTLTPQEFAKGPVNSRLLTENQKLLTLKCMTLGTDEAPEGISQKMSLRDEFNEYDTYRLGINTLPHRHRYIAKRTRRRRAD